MCTRWKKERKKEWMNEWMNEWMKFNTTKFKKSTPVYNREHIVRG